MIRRGGLPLKCRVGVGAVPAFMLAVLIASTTAVCAQVRVQGDAAALQIEANQSQVGDVLATLSKTLPVRVRTSIALDKVINGAYSGSLKQVVSRVLDGYNYVIKSQDMTAEVIVIGVRGGRAIAAEPPTVAPRRSLAAEWRSPIKR